MKHFAISIHFSWLLVSACMLLAMTAQANNIQVTNVSLVNKNVQAGANNAANFVEVKFDLSWENSWRITTNPGNWDAAWVFIKYRVGSGDWQHARLNNTGHTAATNGCMLDVGLLTPGTAFNATTNPGLGAFIYRASVGTGNNDFTNIRLRWNYGNQGVADNATVDVRVLAIEMVLVAEGSLTLGPITGQSPIEGHLGSSSGGSFALTSEAAVTLGGPLAINSNTTGMNGFGLDDFSATTPQTLPAAFPKGFRAFYCMKYELTQQMYVDFFNMLATGQKSNRDITAPAPPNGKGTDAILNRNNISIVSGTAALNGGTHGDVACGFVSWADGTAFADWAGLRPMTELEFEKACGVNIVNQYAWGNATAPTVPTTGLSNDGAANELANNTAANANLQNLGLGGPVRVGMFARAGTTRAQAGASLWGIMELTGNLWERTVTIGNATGRAFTGLHGNGALDAIGNADVANWPGTSAVGSGYRGGTYDNGFSYGRAASRFSAALASTQRNQAAGFRAVRTAL